MTLANSTTTIQFRGSFGSLSYVLGANNTFTVSSGGTLQFDSTVPISGSFGITKNGTGTLNLNGTNTYTGTTTINAGNLTISGGNAIVDNGTVILANIAGVNFNVNASETIGTLQGGGATGGTVNIAVSQTLTVNQTSDQTFAGVIAGSGALTKIGANTLTLSGANTYTGTTTVNAGTLTMGVSNVFDNSSNISIGGGTLDMGTFDDTVNAFTITSGNLSGSGTLTASTYALQGGTVSANLGEGTINATAGTTALNGTAAATTITLNGGNVTLGSAGRLAAGANITLTSGALTLAGAETVNSLTLTGGSLAGSGTLNATTDYDVQSGNITASLGGSAGLTKTTSGTVILSGDNTYTGTTNVTLGTLALGANNVLSDSSNLTVNGGTFDISSYSDTVGVITMTNGSLTGTSGVLTGSAYNITGGTVTAQLGGGTLAIGNSTTQIGAVGSSASLSVDGSSAVANLTADVSALSVTLNDGASITGSFSLNQTGGVTANSGSIASNLIGTGGVTMNGTGNTLTLTGSNAYTGATTLSAGNISISTVSALGSTSGVNLANDTALIYTGGAGNLTRAISVTDGTGTILNSGSGLLTLSGGLSKNGTTLTLQGGSSGITVSGAITGSSANSDLVIDGGTTTLANANTYNGPTSIINGATLNANAVDALPTANERTSISMDATGTGSSTLSLGANQSIASLSGAASSNITLGSNTLTIGTTSGNTTFDGRISGSGNLVKDGDSTLILSGSNSFNGSTTITGGTLNAANANALGTNATVQVNGGSLLVSADDAINGKNIELGGSGVGLQFSGTYNGSIGLLTLSANSTLDLGTSSVRLIFASIAGLANYKLSIWNWSGNTQWSGSPGGGTDQLSFTNASGLTGNLGRISFYSDLGQSRISNNAFTVGSPTEIVAVPEPGLIITAAALFAFLLFRLARQPREANRVEKF